MMSGSSSANITLPSDRELAIERVFDAPRDLVWKAHTEPALLAQWWGTKESTTIIDQLDLQPGGVWRYIQRAADGSEYSFNGVFQEIVPPERLVYTFEFEGLPGHILTETIRFVAEEDGRTKLMVTSIFDSKEDRDGMIASGMEAGAVESWNALEELLKREMRNGG